MRRAAFAAVTLEAEYSSASSASSQEQEQQQEAFEAALLDFGVPPESIRGKKNVYFYF